MTNYFKGLEPYFRPDSKVLILGSFPSVKSRAEEFYYANPQNRFWRVLAEYFEGTPPQTLDEKKRLLSENKIALWDIVMECEIKGSMDNSISNYLVSDLKKLLQNSKISSIILNGGKAAEIFAKNYPDLKSISISLPSTSPANTKFDKGVWFDGLSTAFERTQ